MSHCPICDATPAADEGLPHLAGLDLSVAAGHEDPSTVAHPLAPGTELARKFEVAARRLKVMFGELYEHLRNPNLPTRATMKTIEMEYGFYGTPHHAAPGPRPPGADR